MDPAKELRKNMTDAELALWKQIRCRQILGCKFRRQAPIGKYIVDFVSFERKFIIEVDGGQHADRIEYDTKRSSWLESQGFRVMRVWNNEVLENMEGVLEAICSQLKATPHPNPPPQGGRGSRG